MIYRLEKAFDEGMRITKTDSGEVVKKKFYSSHMTARLAVPSHKTLGKAGAFDTGLTANQEGELETLLEYNKGDLSNKSLFWTAYGIKIPAIGLVLNDEIPEEALMIAILKGRAKTVGDIVFTKSDIRKNANAKWILSNDEAEAEDMSNSITWIARASQKYDSMGIEDYENYLKSVGTDTRGMSTKIIRGRVAQDVKSSPKKFLLIAEDKYQTEKIFINDMIAYGILKMNKASYVNEDNAIVAYTQADMLEYINNKTNAKVVLAWKKQLEEAKKNN